MIPSQSQPDATAVREALAVFHEDGELIEIRCIPREVGSRFHTRDLDQAAAFAVAQNALGRNCYHITNRIVSDIPNSDADDDQIERLRWVLYDIDPVRAIKGTHSATDREKQEARKIGDALLHFWHSRGIRPALIDSGNGYIIFVPIDAPPENSVVVQALLKAHASIFDTEGAHIDLSVFNPSRIIALPGTIKRKGENTSERPWRQVQLLETGSRLNVLDAEALKKLTSTSAWTPPATQKPLIATSGVSSDWVEEFMEHAEITHRGRENYKNGYRWVLDCDSEDFCPNHLQHNSANGPSTQAVFLQPNGIPGYVCSHSACTQITWKPFADYHDDKNELAGRGRFRKGIPDTPDEIVIAGNWLNAAVEKSEAGLARQRELKYYRRGQDLVRPVSFDGQQQVSGISRDAGSIVIQPASDETILRDLGKCARFTKPGKKGEARTPTNPPRELSRHIKDRVASAQAGYPALDMITSSPCLLPNGTVLDTPGYRERVLLMPGGTYPRVKEEPTLEDAKAALKKFDDLYCEFPFVGSEGQVWNETASYAVLLAAVLSMLARPALDTVPLTAMDATTPGTGKTKLVESACIAALGYTPTSVSFQNDEEFSKVLVPLLREGDRAILIDNVSVPLHGDMLCSVLSSKEHRARPLGTSEQIRLLNKGVFFTTGNNLAIQGDLTRRALVVGLDAECERPEDRRFDFDPVQRARELHPELAVAGLTALRAYILAGKPESPLFKRAPLGSFETWDRLIVGCLLWCGYSDPVETKNRVIEGDPQREADIELLKTWHDVHGEKPLSVSELLAPPTTTLTVNRVRDLLVGEGADPRSIGRRLGRLKGKVLDGLKLRAVRGHLSRGWQVLKIAPRHVASSKNSPPIEKENSSYEFSQGFHMTHNDAPASGGA